MIVVDTNILVRIAVDDDAGQANRAEAVLRSGPVRLLRTVLLEVEWVLRAIYRLPRERVQAILRGFVMLPEAEIEDGERVMQALDWFEAGLDFADALHLAMADADETFVTFDQGLIRGAARLGLPVPVREP